jgi:lipoate-protein ligase A
MTSSDWFLLNSGAGEPAFNMALDEALLEAMPRLGHPVLRFFGWTEPAASFGYFQKHAEIEQLTPLRPLIRRPTGGGLVPHAADWTYSAAFPSTHEWYSASARESYQRIHEWIRNALTRLGLAVILAPSRSKSSPGQCFAGFEQFDLLHHGQKIAGAAQRRRRDGLLIQGSVQPCAHFPARAQWEKAMYGVGKSERGISWIQMLIDDQLMQRAAELAQRKYSQHLYNCRR